MKNTFNVKIVIFLILLIISLVSVTSVFIFDLAPFDGKEQVFIPLIIAMSFTLIRFYNNLIEKSKIVENIKKKREDSLNENTMEFNTCPEYWTKTTINDKAYCRNFFIDKDDEMMVIGGKLITASNPHNDLNTSNLASNIGFFHSYKVDAAGSNIFDNLAYTYIPSLRSNIKIQTQTTKNPIVEQFSSDPQEDTMPHMHERTEILYTPTGKDIEWADGVTRTHDTDKLKDDKHLQVYNYKYVHDHTTDEYYGLDFKKYDLESGDFVDVRSTLTGEVIEDSTRKMYSNDGNWISPYKKDNVLYAEINLEELNKASNKCELVKHFPWIEAESKCENVRGGTS